MRSRIVTFAFTCVISSGLSLSRAQAQPACPAGTTSPLTLLVGTWTFGMKGYLPAKQPYAAAGQLTASIRTVKDVQAGILTIVQSSSFARQERDVGAYQVFPDCSGGTLTFTLSSRPLTFDFWFDESFGEIRFVSTTSGAVIHGSAEPNTGATPPQGSCQPSSSLSALVTGMNVVSYVPKGNWGRRHRRFRREHRGDRIA